MCHFHMTSHQPPPVASGYTQLIAAAHLEGLLWQCHEFLLRAAPNTSTTSAGENTSANNKEKVSLWYLNMGYFLVYP